MRYLKISTAAISVVAMSGLNLLGSLTSFAADSAQGTSIAASSQPRKIGIGLGLAYETSLQERKDPNHVESLYLTTSPNYAWSDKFKTTLNLITRQQLTGDIDYHMHKATLSTAWAGKQLNPMLTFKGAVSFGLPLSKDRYDRESYLTGVSLLPELDLDMTQAGAPWLSAAYILNPARLFHRYFENTTGLSNTEYSLVNDMSIGFAITDKLSFTSEYIYTTKWTYNGIQTNDFEWDQSIGYQVTPKMSISGGIGTAASTLKDDGFTDAITFFNAQLTTVSVSVDFKI